MIDDIIEPLTEEEEKAADDLMVAIMAIVAAAGLKEAIAAVEDVAGVLIASAADSPAEVWQLADRMNLHVRYKGTSANLELRQIRDKILNHIDQEIKH